MSESILYRAGSGVAGEITRPQSAIVESGVLDAVDTPTAFGVGVVLDSGAFRKFKSGDAAADIYGLLVRNAPSIAGTADAEGFGEATPNANAIQGIAKRCYMNVKCTIGTPVRGGAVYVRIVADTGKAIGDFEATFDNGGAGPDANELVPGLVWASDGKDANSIAEVSYVG